MMGIGPERRVVWVVDDSPLDSARAVRALSADYAVTTFLEGSTALEHIVSGTSPDAMVLDLMMPGLSGIEICRFLRADGATHQKLGILLLTVARDSDQVVAGLSAGANDYLAKPFEDAELRARIAALLRTRVLLERSESAEARIRELLEKAPDALLSFDARGLVVFANEEAARIFGVPADALSGRWAHELLPDLARAWESPEGRDAAAHLPDVELNGGVYAPTWRVLGPGASAHRTVSFRDVTATRREEARRMDFYSMVAHDIRSPLSAVMMRNALMQRGRHGVLPPALLGELRKTETTMQSLLRLINDFLDFSRMDGPGLKLERETSDLGALMRATLDDLRPLSDARQLRISFEPDVAAALVKGDRHRLLRVMTNLLSNAIKFTPPGGSIDIIMRVETDMIETGVRDTGRGIPASALPTLFDRFTQVAAAPGAGTGLGLMIAKQIVEAHGGRLWVESQEGAGSTFWFSIPRCLD